MSPGPHRRSPAAAPWAWLALLALGLLVTACAGERFPQSTLHPESDAAGAIDSLYRQIFWWAVFVFVVVQSALVVTLIRYRKRPGQGEPKQTHGHTLVEIAWTLAPALILVFIAVPTIKTIFRLKGSTPRGALQVEVTGHQWWWEFRYPELGIVTANELHVPLGREVALSITSADVIHSFWAPRLSGKRDAMPGRTTRLQFVADSVGTYLGQCAEFCGDSHANMRLRVMVDSPAEFAAWAARQVQPPPPVDSTRLLVLAGEAAFKKIRTPGNHSCVACHTIAGVSGGVMGPNLTHVGSRTTIAGATLPNDSAGIARWLRDPAAVKPGALMPTINLTDQEIAALIAYLQSRK
jgi:cytochrome c oxidase subunit 2